MMEDSTALPPPKQRAVLQPTPSVRTHDVWAAFQIADHLFLFVACTAATLKKCVL